MKRGKINWSASFFCERTKATTAAILYNFFLISASGRKKGATPSLLEYVPYAVVLMTMSFALAAATLELPDPATTLVVV